MFAANDKIQKDIDQYSAFQLVTQINLVRKMVYWIISFFVLIILISFLPWTQNIPANGKLTTLLPEHRPQSVYSTIAGRIDQWYVREGQSVKKGDTLAYLTEIKVDYFDPRLLERTQDQVNAKSLARSAYQEKAQALSEQLTALQEGLILKLEQTKNKIRQYELKITSDSMEVKAAKLAYDIALFQYERTDTLHQKGIKSLTDLEEKRNKAQSAQAKLISSENKLLISQSILINTQIELNTIQRDYADKIAKSRSERSSAVSSSFDAESQISKLESTYSSYEERSQHYYIIAPQGGYITKILKKGLGEIVKESEVLLTIMPTIHELAVEVYVRPMDYPLLKIDQPVRFIFDGWPAFVFSGWPEQSYGTFGGRIVSIDNMTNEKGYYRLLVSPDPDPKEKPWPKALRVGAGASGTIMLNDVPLWYEFWRQLNGFPPEYYETDKIEKYKLKAPASHFKK